MIILTVPLHGDMPFVFELLYKITFIYYGLLKTAVFEMCRTSLILIHPIRIQSNKVSLQLLFRHRLRQEYLVLLFVPIGKLHSSG